MHSTLQCNYATVLEIMEIWNDGMEWNYGMMDTSPTGHFAYWTVRLLDISPTTWTVRLQIALVVGDDTEVPKKPQKSHLILFRQFYRQNGQSVGRLSRQQAKCLVGELSSRRSVQLPYGNILPTYVYALSYQLYIIH